MTKPETMTTESPFSSQAATGKSVDRNPSMAEEVEKQENGEPKHRSTPSLPKSFSMSFDNFDGASQGVPKKCKATVDALEAMVHEMGGDKAIHSVLVANNGLAAVKFIRSVRNWAFKKFGDEGAVNLIAMATPEDMKADAEHIRLADQFIEVPGGRNVNNYANVQLIVSLAMRARVDAVWPGWGHASEIPELPELLGNTPTGIRFIGPYANAMAALGDKIGSTILAQSAGVPTLAWSGDGVQIAYEDCPGGEIPRDVYEKACLHNVAEAVACYERINSAIMLKASWGGGGKGIRMVRNVDEVPHAFKQVQAEVPGSPIFAMKLARQSRHLEVQLLCDMYGNVCSVFSRDCSVQRRHQKIVEEGPVTVAPQKTLKHMEKCARALARSVGYVGAATVEFLYAMEDGEYCFLELNPRLQVEHPVTEWISGVNIPACQLLIAQGVPLNAIPDLRRLYGKEPNGSDAIDFEDEPSRNPPSGHVLAVRITAENANDGFKPTAGKIDEISFRSTPDVWGYFSVKSGGAVHEFSDSQFGHLFAKGESRNAAIRAMVVALKELRVRGEIRTNSDYVCDLIQTEDFVQDKHHTGWLDNRIAKQITTGTPPWHLSVVCGAAVRASEHFNRRVVEYLGYLEKGQLPPARISMVSSIESFVVDGEKFSVEVTKAGPQMLSLRLNGSSIDIVSRKLNDGGLLIQLDGVSHVVHAEEEPSGTRLTIDTSTCLLSNEHDPSQLKALSTGKLIRYLVEDGDHLDSNAPYAEIEVMKMVMTLLTPAAGVITFELPEGSVLTPGNLIARLKLDDPASVRMATPFMGQWPELGPPVVRADGVEKRFLEAMTNADNILAGYPNSVDNTVNTLWEAVNDPVLGLVQWNEAYSVVSSRIPMQLAAQLETIADDCAADLEDTKKMKLEQDCSAITAAAMVELLDAMAKGIDDAAEDDRPGLVQLLEPLQAVARDHSQGLEAYAMKVAKRLMDTFLEVEEHFQTTEGMTEQEVIDSMRKSHASDLQSVVDMALSHNGLSLKTDLIRRILSTFVVSKPDQYRKQLRRLASLYDRRALTLALEAQKLLEDSLLGELRNIVGRVLSGEDIGIAPVEPVRTESLGAPGRRMTVTEGLFAGLTNLTSPSMQSASVEDRISMLVEAPAAVEDALALLLLDDQELEISQKALRTYIKRLYHPYILVEPQLDQNESMMLASWAFEDQAAAETTSSKECVGGAFTVATLKDIPAVLKAFNSSKACSSLKAGLCRGTLHIVLLGQDESVLTLESDAAQELEKLDQDVIEQIKRVDGDTIDPRKLSASFLAQIRSLSGEILASGFSSISLLSKRGNLSPLKTALYFSQTENQFVLDPVLCRMEPPTARCLESEKLISFPKASYSCSRNRQWHIYSACEGNGRSIALKRVFARGIVRQIGRPDLLAATYSGNSAAAAAAAVQELQDSIQSAISELDRAAHMGENSSRADWAHIFLNVTIPLAIGDKKDEMPVALALRSAAASVTSAHITSLRHSAVAQWEVRLRVSGKSGSWRVIVSVPTGHESGEECVDIYREVSEAGCIIYHGIVGSCPLANKPVMSQYEPLEMIQIRQLAARRHKTTYCYDFPAVFEHALMQVWASRAAAGEPDAVPPSSHLVDALELVPRADADLSFRHTTPLVAIKRPASCNKVGVVAWLMTLHTPEYPQGRQIVTIANDITHSFGAFGPKEDAMFRAATEFALENRLPVVYLAANSGARVGLANELKQCINAAWQSPDDPTKGFKYLYLTPEDHDSLMARGQEQGINPFNATLIEEEGERRYKITDIIGLEDGLGVECLSGSGSIAGVYSKAFKEGFTLTLVSGRTVGIGAYLARLGRRCIQRKDQPIILTGYAALNKLLGRDVYTSHMQLGGPRIMGTNGVSHHVVSDDLEGITKVLEWISFVPARNGETVPRLPTSDSITRKVAYTIAEGKKLDPRIAIAGCMDETTGAWVSGMFDKGSWVEAQPNWARTVVTGRARLGGIACGIIAVEVDTVMLDIPADPGMPDSSEKTVPQAGQVWFPDSALKTAHAMEEFDLEGLPLFVMANWRGFSGGQRDLFEGVLQAGSLIVENLRSYRRPVFMYIPPGCELRGGAWVVIDSQINPDQVESYADTTGKGGVLEPEGMVEIKFREKELVAAMHRLDPVIRQLSQKYKDNNHPDIKARVSKLLPVYTGIAQSFAQMHDTPVRMLAKGVIQGIVPWENSRNFFATRLKRRLAEEALYNHLRAADSSITLSDAKHMVRAWFLTSPRLNNTKDHYGSMNIQLVSTHDMTDEDKETAWSNDAAFMEWVESPNGASRIAVELKSLRQKSAAHLVATLSDTSEGTEGLIKGLEAAIDSNPSLLLQLRNLLNLRS